ncbi:MAG: ABC transporter ATP-binding protein [Archaeoglobaceae archaeon]|nr:ABC transporter ATP-binding protein [Archaeoglobaceae archaeon]MCX8151995.1 ABC transporter ATP-binding protein [Archaeoglobaceae archaeon]MDW8013384.1 ABC transporter ATP-binding protein [Archaeoglobaceae archaeon]
MEAIECRDVWMIYKTFLERETVALQGVNLKIEQGEIFGILGPNGAGKTTLISIMSTILVPTKGEVKILGLDAFKNTKFVRRKINIASGSRMPWGLRVYECLKFYAMCYGIKDDKKVEELLEMFELKDHRNLRFDELSAGNRQKLNLARALLNDPEIIFLDEPTANLDPDVAKRIREFILDLNEKGKTVVLTTHNMREAEKLCDRIAFLKGGKVYAVGDLNYFKKLIKKREKIVVEFSGEVDLKSLKYPYELDGNKLTVFVEDSEKEIVDLMVKLQGSKIESIKVEGVTLEDVFIEIAKLRY